MSVENNIDGEIRPTDELHGLLVTYCDDQLNECVKSAIRRKSRVRYKSMDTFAKFLAFGTSGGAIYLFTSKSSSNSSCSLITVIPCDQGSIEVIRFLSSSQTNDLLVAIGTSRGSLVVFRLILPISEDDPVCDEIYKAESFTNNSAIRLIECDQNFLDSTPSLFSKLYICDSANRIYVLESSSIYSNKQSLRLFYTSHLPSLILSVNDSKINQISVHKSQLLISTDETTRLFSEQTNQINIIGRKKRKEGFYGSCFFNPDYKPFNKMVQVNRSKILSPYSSTNSLHELENLFIFVARPMFRLWQVNNRREVMFTHQFDSQVKAVKYNQIIELQNEPLNEDAIDDPVAIMTHFLKSRDELEPTINLRKSDHFEKLTQIYSSTIGNLLLSYTQHNIFIIDPIRAKLIIRHFQESPIVQVCCNENELYVWSRVDTDGDQRDFQVKRLVLMAPTQFVLELHRIHSYLTMAVFVQHFSDLFRHQMALPLSGPTTITTEGGLLRNVLLNAQDMCESRAKDNEVWTSCDEFRRMITDIIEESKQLQKSFENLTDSRFFLTMTSDNIDRLCTEPYASLLSLEVSIKDLHTTKVIHFNKDAIVRHKSVANLSQGIKMLNAAAGRKNISVAKSTIELSRRLDEQPENELDDQQFNKNQAEAPEKNAENCEPLTTIKEVHLEEPADRELQRMIDTRRCTNCHWPRSRSHLKRLDASQRIQLNWIESNLMGNFEENVDRIETHAFKHGLWHMFLKCLAFKNQLADYITCCMLLDDIRLLEVEQLMIIRYGEEMLLEITLEHLGRKAELFDRIKEEKLTSDEKKDICLKCEAELEPLEQISDEELISNGMIGDDNQEDAFDFRLVNLIGQFLSRKDADFKKIIRCLLKFPKLLDGSRIPSAFFLKAIAKITLASNSSVKMQKNLNGK